MNKLVNGKFTGTACGLIKRGDRGNDENDCDVVSVCEIGGRVGCSCREKSEKWKAPVIKSLKGCESGAHRSKQTLIPHFLFMYPNSKPLTPIPLLFLPHSLLVSLLLNEYTVFQLAEPLSPPPSSSE